MFTRVTTFPGLAPERIKATIAEFEEKHLPAIEQQPGFLGVWAGVDFPGGRAIAVTYWESMQALRAADQLADQARAAVISTQGLDRDRPPVTDRYEIVLQRDPAHAVGST
jgi:heme-degrading monooxygenase HmoA